MRKHLKILSSILSAAMIMSSLSAVALADPIDDVEVPQDAEVTQNDSAQDIGSPYDFDASHDKNANREVPHTWDISQDYEYSESVDLTQTVGLTQDAVQAQVVEEGMADDFYWVLYDDGLLHVYTFNYDIRLLSINATGAEKKGYVNENTQRVLNAVTSIVIEFYDEYNYYESDNEDDAKAYIYFRVYGGNCNASSLTFIGDENTYFNTLTISEFPNLDSDNINIPQSQSCKTVEIRNTGVSSLDFISGIPYDRLTVRECNNLQSVNVPATSCRTNIRDCEELNNLTFNDSWPVISESNKSGDVYVSLYNLPNLSKLSLPAIDDEQLSASFNITNCGMTEIEIPDYSEHVDVYLSGNTKLEKATLLGTHTYASMFNNCTSLSEVNLPDGVTTIEYAMFKRCSSLKSIELPDSLISICARAFSESGLTSIKIPTGVTNLEYGTFKDCKSLKSVYIPTELKSIDIQAFEGCTSLTDVYYDGTEEQWNQIKVVFDPEEFDSGTLKDVFGNATIHFKVTNAWVEEEDNWYYFDGEGNKVTGWHKIGAWYYFDEDGVMLTGWQKIDGVWYYLRSSGSMYTGWLQYGGSWYYLKPSGAMATGWEKVNGTWYYFSGSGKMLTGWQQSGGTWYYLESSGAMKTGWLLSGGNWYYMRDSGAMAIGWVQSGGNWYYFNASGAMVTGWKTIGQYTYYFDSNGKMVTGTVTIDGKRYKFADDGHCMNP